MDLIALKAELLAGHPVTGAYDVDHQLAADQLNAPNRSRQRTTLSASEIFEALDITEYDALALAQRERIQLVLSLGDAIQIGPSTRTRAILLAAFTAGSNTRANLLVAVAEPCGRAVELFSVAALGGDVEKARAL